MKERAFQNAVERVRQSTNGEDLAASVRIALTEILPQPENRELLASLLSQAETITDRLPGFFFRTQPEEVRQAAIRCVMLLEFAREGGAGAEAVSSGHGLGVIVLAAASALGAVLYGLLLM